MVYKTCNKNKSTYKIEAHDGRLYGRFVSSLLLQSTNCPRQLQRTGHVALSVTRALDINGLKTQNNVV